MGIYKVLIIRFNRGLYNIFPGSNLLSDLPKAPPKKASRMRAMIAWTYGLACW